MTDHTRLLLAARDGDEHSFAAWVRQTQAEVWRLCAHLVDAQAADDVTQQVYIRAWSALPAFRGDASARTWLLAIARRTCADAVRSRVRRRRLRDRAAARAALQRPPDEAEALTLTDLVARLAPDRRVAFVLTQVLELSYAEASQVCACPVGTIRSRVARARGDLISALGAGRPSGAGAPGGAGGQAAIAAAADVAAHR